MHSLPRWSPRLLRFLFTFAILMFFLVQPSLANSQSKNEPALLNSPHLIPAVIYVDSAHHIHEIALKSTWVDRDLSYAAGAPDVLADSDPMAFRRSDGVSMIVYRGVNYHIYALYLELKWAAGSWQENWHCVDMNAITGAPLAISDPFGYVRGDGVSAVVYNGEGGHIIELRLQTIWIWADLTVIPNAPLAIGYSRPAAFVRADGVSTIVYIALSNRHICELRLQDSWYWADLTAISGAVLPNNYIGAQLSANLRSDGVSGVLYTGDDYHVHEIWLGTAWTWADLTLITGAPTSFTEPYGYVRSDGINAVVYSSYVEFVDYARIIELRLDSGWQSFELTSIAGAVRGSCPMGFVRADGINQVIYAGEHEPDNHVDSFYLQSDGWHYADLTAISGGLNSIGCPFPYNRSSVAYMYLPLVIKP